MENTVLHDIPPAHPFDKTPRLPFGIEDLNPDLARQPKVPTLARCYFRDCRNGLPARAPSRGEESVANNRDDKPKRLRKVFRAMRDFGDHLQYSIFECQFTPIDLANCRQLLGEIIKHNEDQVLFVDLGPAEGRGERVISA